MSNFFKFVLIFIFLLSCSLDSKSGFWSKPQKIKKENEIVIKKLFEEDKSLDNEFNKNVKNKIKFTNICK